MLYPVSVKMRFWLRLDNSYEMSAGSNLHELSIHIWFQNHKTGTKYENVV